MTMKSLGQHRIRISGISFRAVTIALSLALLFALVAVVTPASQAQTYTYKVLHNFTGGLDGGNPRAGVTYKAGNLYGTTYSYGAHNSGVVYELKVSELALNPIYSFTGGSDGADPQARVVFRS